MINRITVLAFLILTACSPRDGSDGGGNVAAGPPTGAESNDVIVQPAIPATTGGNVSRFTTDGLNRCKLIEKNEEEGPYYRHRCPGVGGFSYELVESDLRQSLVIIAPDGRRDEVSPVEATGRSGFNTLGATFDWRGPAGARPRSVTVRFIVSAGPDGDPPARSYLLVIRLAAPACVVAVVPPGLGQNDRARAIADRATLPGCVVA